MRYMVGQSQTFDSLNIFWSKNIIKTGNNSWTINKSFYFFWFSNFKYLARRRLPEAWFPENNSLGTKTAALFTRTLKAYHAVLPVETRNPKSACYSLISCDRHLCLKSLPTNEPGWPEEKAPRWGKTQTSSLSCPLFSRLQSNSRECDAAASVYLVSCELL